MSLNNLNSFHNNAKNIINHQTWFVIYRMTLPLDPLQFCWKQRTRRYLTCIRLSYRDLRVSHCVNTNISVLNRSFVWCTGVSASGAVLPSSIPDGRGMPLREGRWKKGTFLTGVCSQAGECYQVELRKENLWKQKFWKWIPLEPFGSVSCLHIPVCRLWTNNSCLPGRVLGTGKVRPCRIWAEGSARASQPGSLADIFQDSVGQLWALNQAAQCCGDGVMNKSLSLPSGSL